jgi:hypothetical protein
MDLSAMCDAEVLDVLGLSEVPSSLVAEMRWTASLEELGQLVHSATDERGAGLSRLVHAVYAPWERVTAQRDRLLGAEPGVALQEADNWRELVVSVRVLKALVPRWWDVQYYDAMLARALGENRRAVEVLERMKASSGATRGIRTDIGFTWLAEGDAGAALGAFIEAREAGEADPRLALGEAACLYAVLVSEPTADVALAVSGQARVVLERLRVNPLPGAAAAADLLRSGLELSGLAGVEPSRLDASDPGSHDAALQSTRPSGLLLFAVAVLCVVSAALVLGLLN